MYKLHNQDTLFHLVALFLILISCFFTWQSLAQPGVFLTFAGHSDEGEFYKYQCCFPPGPTLALGGQAESQLSLRCQEPCWLTFKRIRNQRRALGQYFSNFGISPAGGRPTISANEMFLITSPGCGPSLMFLCRAHTRCVMLDVGMGVTRVSVVAEACFYFP